VSRLRKVLEPEGGREVLVTRSPGYALRLEADQLDLLRFEALVIQARTELDDGRAAAAAARLREALGLWRLQEQILTQDPALDHERPPRAAAPRERMGVLLVAAVAAAAVVAIALTGGDDDAPVEPSGGNVAVIDADTGQTRTRVAAGGTPSTIALGAGAAWVVDADAQTVSRIDLRSRAVTTFATGATPTDVAVGRAEYGSAAAAP